MINSKIRDQLIKSKNKKQLAIVLTVNLFLITSTFSVFCQNNVNGGKMDYIINTSEYEKGVYQNFEDFKYNRPSYKGQFEFNGKNLFKTDLASGKNIKIRKGQVWGFCDGTRIYIRHRKYNPLLIVDRYSYFEESGVGIVWMHSFFPPAIIPLPMPYKNNMIVNFNNGQMYMLSKRIVKTILKKDSELFDKFQQEQQKGKKLVQYIKLYNERHRDQIK